MQCSINVEDGEVEEENDLKGQTIESRFSSSQIQMQPHESEDNMTNPWGSSSEHRQSEHEFRYGQERRNPGMAFFSYIRKPNVFCSDGSKIPSI